MKVCLGEKMLNYTLNFDNEMSKQWLVHRQWKADGVLLVTQDNFFLVDFFGWRTPCLPIPAATKLEIPKNWILNID